MHKWSHNQSLTRLKVVQPHEFHSKPQLPNGEFICGCALTIKQTNFDSTRKKAFILRFLETGQHACMASANKLGSFKTRQGPASVIIVFRRPSKPQIYSQNAIWVKQCRSQQEAEVIITYLSIFIKSCRKKKRTPPHTLETHSVATLLGAAGQMVPLGMGTWWGWLETCVQSQYQFGFICGLLIYNQHGSPKLSEVKDQNGERWTDWVQNLEKGNCRSNKVCSIRPVSLIVLL